MGGQEDLSEPENFFCLFLEQDIFFSRALWAGLFFLKPPRALFIKLSGDVDIQVLHLPDFFFQNYPFSQKYFLFIMRKVISQV